MLPYRRVLVLLPRVRGRMLEVDAIQRSEGYVDSKWYSVEETLKFEQAFIYSRFELLIARKLDSGGLSYKCADCAQVLLDLSASFTTHRYTVLEHLALNYFWHSKLASNALQCVQKGSGDRIAEQLRGTPDIGVEDDAYPAHLFMVWSLCHVSDTATLALHGPMWLRGVQSLSDTP